MKKILSLFFLLTFGSLPLLFSIEERHSFAFEDQEFSLQWEVGEKVDRIAKLNFALEAEDHEIFGRITLSAQVEVLEVEPHLLLGVVVKRVYGGMQIPSLSGFALDFDSARGKARGGARWWKQRRLQKELEEPLLYSCDEEGRLSLLEEERVAERFEGWPYLLHFFREGVAPLLFSREFAFQGAVLQEGFTPKEGDGLIGSTEGKIFVPRLGKLALRVLITDEQEGEGNKQELVWRRNDPLLFEMIHKETCQVPFPLLALTGLDLGSYSYTHRISSSPHVEEGAEPSSDRDEIGMR